MDQLAADLNSALNDANVSTSTQSNTPMASSYSTILKTRRRRKRPMNNETQQQKTEASDSTTPENTRNRTNINKQSASDVEDIIMTSKTQSPSLLIASESDSASQPDEVRRRRRPFKKPAIPSLSTILTKSDQPTRLIRCSSMKLPNSTSTTTTTTISTYGNHRCQNCRIVGQCRKIDIDDNTFVPSSSSSFAGNINDMRYDGKRKRSRAIIHDDFRFRNHSLHDYDMTYIDDSANISSDSSLNLSESDKEPCLTSNEADDEQSDWPRDESSVPRCLSLKHDDENNSHDDDDDDDDKMLTTNAGTLEKIVNSAVNMVLCRPNTTVQSRIKSLVNREMLTGNRRNISSKNNYTTPHLKRNVRLLKETRRSHHNSYNHKRVKSEHYPLKHHDIMTSNDSPTMTHQLSDKIDWTSGISSNQDIVTTSVNVDYRYCRKPLGCENTSMDITERMDSELQSPSSSSRPSHM